MKTIAISVFMACVMAVTAAGQSQSPVLIPSAGNPGVGGYDILTVSVTPGNHEKTGSSLKSAALVTQQSLSGMNFWKEEQGVMKLYMKHRFSYDTAGREVQDLVSQDDGNGTMIYYQKTTYDYDSYGYLKEIVKSLYNTLSGSWTNSTRREFVNDTSGNVLEDISYHWDVGWVPDKKKYKEYNSINKMTLREKYCWNETEEKWIYDTASVIEDNHDTYVKTEYTYFSNGINKSRIDYKWSDNGSGLVPCEKETAVSSGDVYRYDIFHYNEDNEEWVENSYFLYRYEMVQGYYFLTSMEGYTFEDDRWYWKYSASADTLGRLIGFEAEMTDAQTDAWFTVYKKERDFNAAGDITEERFYNNPSFIPDYVWGAGTYRKEFEYSAERDVSGFYSDGWNPNDEEWYRDGRIGYTYDITDTLPEIILPNELDSVLPEFILDYWDVNAVFDLFRHKILTKDLYQYDPENDSWDLKGRVEFLYTGIPVTGKVEARTQGITVYPNPVKEVLHIDLPGGKEYLVQLYDMKGYLLEERTVVSDRMTWDLSGLSPGLYLLKVTDYEKNAVAAFKVVKER